MPTSSTLFRNRPTQPDPSNVPFVPNYTVLFWHSYDGNWDDISQVNGSFDGKFNPQYYRRYTSISQFPAYPDAKQISYPIIKCVDTSFFWKTETGKMYSADVQLIDSSIFANTIAGFLEVAGAHNPISMLKTASYPAPGFVNGDTQSTDTTKTYLLKNGSQGSHSHFVDDIRSLILGINYGEYKLPANYNTTNISKGLQSLQIDLLLRDPKLSGSDKPLEWLPKNCLVFGASLPEPDYSRDDVYSVNMVPADGKTLPLLARHPNIGVFGSDENDGFISIFGLSSTTTNHNHDLFPITNRRLSNKSGQTGYTWTDAGAHNHLVRYDVEVKLKSKKVKAWVTTLDKTPIADGVILAYAIGPGTNYTGSEDDESILPPHWHFCDGNNGTPDLRGYYIYANFANDDHNVEINSDNTAIVTKTTVSANGNHSHYSLTTNPNLFGTMTDIGGHGRENSLDHTHTFSNATSFKKRPTDAQNVTNFKPGFEFKYTPPTVTLAFIMYNATVA